jgi:hypothetical protein
LLDTPPDEEGDLLPRLLSFGKMAIKYISWKWRYWRAYSQLEVPCEWFIARQLKMAVWELAQAWQVNSQTREKIEQPAQW